MNETLAKSFVGSICVHAWIGYGAPLFATFRRDGRTPANPRRDREIGSLELQTNFSDWTVLDAEGKMDGGPDGCDPEAAAAGLVSKTVSGISVEDDMSLNIEFSDGIRLTIARWPDQRKLTDAWNIDLDDRFFLAVPTFGQATVVDSTSSADWFADGLSSIDPDEP